MRDLIEDLEGHLFEVSTKGGKATVGVFVEVLKSKLTQYDIRNSKKRGYNQYALSAYMGVVQEIRKELASVINSDAPEDLKKLKGMIDKKFIVSDMSPARATLKQIDQYLVSGKMPSLTRK